jgi:hypothetical protein
LRFGGFDFRGNGRLDGTHERRERADIDESKTEVIELMVAGGGIEPPTRGFSGGPRAILLQPKKT